MAKAKITEVMMDDKTIDASKEIAMVFFYCKHTKRSLQAGQV